eukprot:359185-Prymnesium_polylepis.1
MRPNPKPYCVGSAPSCGWPWHSTAVESIHRHELMCRSAPTLASASRSAPTPASHTSHTPHAAGIKVGEVEAAHSEQLRAVVEELRAAGEAELGVTLDAGAFERCAARPSPSPLAPTLTPQL